MAMSRTVSACRTMPTTHASMDGPILLRMTLTMTIDDCFAFAFLMIAVLLSSGLPWLSVRNSSRFEGVVVIAEEKEDAYELQFPCGQRRAYMPVKLMTTLTRQKTILKVSLPRCSALSSLSLGRQRRRNPYEASSRGVGELKGFNQSCRARQ